MKDANHSIAIIRPKRNFIKWANANSLDEREFDAEYFAEYHSYAIIMPYYDLLNRKAAKRYINFICEEIFSHALDRWNPDNNTWPKDLGKATFEKWFTVEYIYNAVE